MAHQLHCIICNTSMTNSFILFHDKFLYHGKLGKKSELHVGFEPRTLRDLVGSALTTELYWRLHGEQG